MRALILILLTLCAACGAPKAVGCRYGVDCASGICLGDGTCGPVPDAGVGGGSAGGGAGGGSGVGGGSGGGSAGGGAGGGSGVGGGTGGGIGLTCSPNHDGSITRAELPLGAGLHATFKIATNATFNTAGSPGDAGTFWDLTVALSGDKSVLVETLPLAGTWYENKFAGATYASRLSDTLLGVFEVASDGLLLRGVVSPADSLSATELTYNPPAKLLAFPLGVGHSWSTTSTVSGRLNGVAWTQTELYDSNVDKEGEVLTAFARFPVQRVKTVLTRTVGFSVTVTRSYQFVTECFGTIAAISSQAGETSTEFTSDAEVRRLVP